MGAEEVLAGGGGGYTRNHENRCQKSTRIDLPKWLWLKPYL